MNTQRDDNMKMTNYRWMICFMLFMATTINYMDRQVLSLTWKDFIAPEFNWTDANYGTIAGFFSILYSVSMLFVGKFVDRIGTKKGYLWAIGIWSAGACLHTFCGIATAGISTGTWTLSFEGARQALEAAETAGTVVWSISTVSIWLFLAARSILAVGESGNFPCAIKVTAEYFPKKDRAFATSVFNAGAQLGALLAPFTIPVIARYMGWEMSFMIIGALGFFWMGFWVRMYDNPAKHRKVNRAELEYIEQDRVLEQSLNKNDRKSEDENKSAKGISLWKCFTFRQTWAVIFGRCLPDGVWWFFLFWAPAYVKDVYGYSSDSTMGMLLIFTLYLISMLSILGGYLPTVFISKLGMNPFAGRMRAMFIFSLFPLIGLFAQPLGNISCWFPIIIIGIIGAAHQSWSANTYTVVSDMFPKSAVATVTGIGGMAGGFGSLLFNQGSGILFTYSKETNMVFMGFEGIHAGYMIVFIIASVAYLFSWIMIKILVPRYKIIEV
ncbi:MAG: MFS transporter [Phocaeicola sp.]|nr:MFS transporter [Phocaeicola sp.]